MPVGPALPVGFFQALVVADGHEGVLEPVAFRDVVVNVIGLEEIGTFDEMGKDRVAFDEGLAKRSIESQGFYRFHSKSLDLLGEPPLPMPM